MRLSKKAEGRRQAGKQAKNPSIRIALSKTTIHRRAEMTGNAIIEFSHLELQLREYSDSYCQTSQQPEQTKNAPFIDLK